MIRLKSRKWSFGAIVIGCSLVLLTGCSASQVRPDFYPNEHLQAASKEQVDRDVAECNDLATTYVKDSTKYDKLARESATGAVIGSASGALTGAILGGGVGRMVGAGAAVGAIIPLLQSLFQSSEASPNREEFVSYCLRERGYQVMGR